MTLIELAEAYYHVASDLRRNALEMNQTAKTLEGIADRYSEQNSREMDPTRQSEEG